MRTMALAAAAVIGLTAFSAEARSCRERDLDGQWQWDAVVMSEDGFTDIQRCRVTFDTPGVSGVWCQVSGQARDPEKFYKEGSYDLPVLFQSCHFKWYILDDFNEGYWLRGQMNQAKDVINGSFDFLEEWVAIGKFTLTRMPGH